MRRRLISEGATALADLVARLTPLRILWLMVPAASVDVTIEQVLPHLASGDILVDGGNSYYLDDIPRTSWSRPASGTWNAARAAASGAGPVPRLVL
jgi:6-phosphogluconate dehydrogenase